MTCRLPQTPRTPSSAASHYFDDVFARGKPRKPAHLRRSSTSRSIGVRSDWNDSTNGDANGSAIEDEEVEPSKLKYKRTNSIGYLDAEALKKKAEVDQQVAHYVSDQLERMKSNDSALSNMDELEAQLDG